MRMDCKSGPFDRPCVSPRRPNSTNAQTLRHAVASSGRRVSSVSAEDRKSPAAAVHCLRSSGPPRLVGTIAQTPPYPLFASRHRCAIPTTARCAPLATSGETGQFSNLPGDRHLRSPVPRPSPAPRPRIVPPRSNAVPTPPDPGPARRKCTFPAHERRSGAANPATPSAWTADSDRARSSISPSIGCQGSSSLPRLHGVRPRKVDGRERSIVTFDAEQEIEALPDARLRLDTEVVGEAIVDEYAPGVAHERMNVTHPEIRAQPLAEYQ